MIPLWQEKGYRFDFDEVRKVERIHLFGAKSGEQVNLFRKPYSADSLATVSGIIGEDGWALLEKPLITAPGDRFVALVTNLVEIPVHETPNHSAFIPNRENA
jgi:hypothetical protein